MVTFKHTSASNLISNFKSELAAAKKRKAQMEDENQKLLLNRKEKSKEIRVSTDDGVKSAVHCPICINYVVYKRILEEETLLPVLPSMTLQAHIQELFSMS